MKQYLELMRHVRTRGVRKADRTGTGTLSAFAYQLRFDLAAGFPLVTTKKIHLPSVIYELLWFLRGETNIAWLREHGIRVEVDDSADRMQKKIRNAQKQKVPFMLLAGDDDVAAGAVSFRYRNGAQRNGVPIDEAIAEIVTAVETHAQV